ncbi:Rhodanese-like domain-containing protein [Mycena belliarum]|uniref:Rhodanese-like domain-containing protein n=1 Tax=Mycena belliarum TaxID=1033014 RepID=A0AAD6UHZ3_9AGAR|nr:Rhodanese-like domain-containing protein [Mycena belliae]
MSGAIKMLLSPARLNQLLRTDAPKTVVLDCSWFMPNSDRSGKAEFRKKRIPGSNFLDLDEVASHHELGLKHMLPSEEVFARACEKLGIAPSSRVVMYDTHGVFSSPRALWMMRAFGHQDSAILDGGLPRWEAEGFPIESTEPQEETLEKVHYDIPTLAPNAVRSYQQIVSNSALIPFQTAGAELVLDARGRGRFMGTEADPRSGVASGHIPNSVSVPFDTFLQKHVAQNGSTYTTLLPEPELRAALVDVMGADSAQAVFNGDIPVITSCGSGMTAAVLWLGLQTIGVKQISIYDESWAGYGVRSSSKIETSH